MAYRKLETCRVETFDRFGNSARLEVRQRGRYAYLVLDIKEGKRCGGPRRTLAIFQNSQKLRTFLGNAIDRMNWEQFAGEYGG